MTEILAKFRGTMLGLAIGDALGFPVEFIYDRKGIYTFFNSQGKFPCVFIENAFPRGFFSDDTQMSIAVAKSLIESGNSSVESLLDTMTNYFIEWYRSPDNNRAPGNTCMSSCARLSKGVHWSKSGTNNNSKGCGTAMRSAPIGLYYYRLSDRQKLIEVASESSLMTHGHPCATAGSVANALAISMALNEVPIDNWLPAIIKTTTNISEEFVNKMKDIKEALRLDPFAGVDFLGQGWVAEEAIAIALYSFLRYPNNFCKMMELAVVHQGDSDSTGCIAGGFFGAWNGIDKLPSKLVRTVEKSQTLIKLADQLYLKGKK